jgi:hypothetical protein
MALQMQNFRTAALSVVALSSAALMMVACSTTRVTEETAVLPLPSADRDSRLSVVNEVMARYQFIPVSTEQDSWIEVKASGNSQRVETRHYVLNGSSSKKACSATLSLVREQLRVSLQGPKCSSRARTIAQSLRTTWEETASTAGTH